jgi:hypothetical protein
MPKNHEDGHRSLSRVVGISFDGYPCWAVFVGAKLASILCLGYLNFEVSGSNTNISKKWKSLFVVVTVAIPVTWRYSPMW